MSFSSSTIFFKFKLCCLAIRDVKCESGRSLEYTMSHPEFPSLPRFKCLFTSLRDRNLSSPFGCTYISYLSRWCLRWWLSFARCDLVIWVTSLRHKKKGEMIEIFSPKHYLRRGITTSCIRLDDPSHRKCLLRARCQYFRNRNLRCETQVLHPFQNALEQMFILIFQQSVSSQNRFRYVSLVFQRERLPRFEYTTEYRT